MEGVAFDWLPDLIKAQLLQYYSRRELENKEEEKEDVKDGE